MTTLQEQVEAIIQRYGNVGLPEGDDYSYAYSWIRVVDGMVCDEPGQATAVFLEVIEPDGSARVYDVYDFEEFVQTATEQLALHPDTPEGIRAAVEFALMPYEEG